MQLEQKFSLAAPVDTVWQAFHDVRLLVDCLPGASLDDTKPENEEGMALVFKVKLGPIAAGFAGRGRVALDEAGRTGSFGGSAVDAKTNSRVKGEAGFALTGDGASTVVTVTVNFTITGALAQFSREGIVRALAETLTRQFADNLQARLPQAGSASVVPQASTASDVPQAASEPEEAQSPPESTGVLPADAAASSGMAPAQPAAPSSSAAPAPQRHADTSTLDAWTLIKAWWRGLWAKGGRT